MRKVLFATTNPHKLEEIRAILSPHDLEIVSLNDLPGAGEIPEPVEDATSFEGNAALKATYYAERTGMLTLADDSGLEVDALGGEPGVRSARYADERPERSRAERDEANNAKLLAALEGVPDEERGARFVCVVALADPSGAVLATARGTFEGSIAHAPRGDNGFGYDPLLLVAGDPQGRTAAELTPAQKNDRSHRANAARRIAMELPRVIG